MCVSCVAAERSLVSVCVSPTGGTDSMTAPVSCVAPQLHKTCVAQDYTSLALHKSCAAALHSGATSCVAPQRSAATASSLSLSAPLRHPLSLSLGAATASLLHPLSLCVG